MKRLRLTNQGLGLSAFFILTTTVHASIPLESLSPNGNSEVNESATTLSASPSALALSVKDTALNLALTGKSRYITIKNTGTKEAKGINITYPDLPGGVIATTASSTCGSSLAAGATCTITISPGSNATGGCNTGIAPTPGKITVSATNVAQAVSSNVVVLSYGCQYQGGFLYSVDDTTTNKGSIGGKVVSLVDQGAPYINTGPQRTSTIWSSNGYGRTRSVVSYDVIPLISENATPDDSYDTAQKAFNSTYSNISAFPFPASSVFATCDGATDGSCNSGNILAFYKAYNTGYGIGSGPYTLSAGPTNPTYYAAGLCTATIDGYSDWYLPSICEMDTVSGNVNCYAENQSMVANLSFLIGNSNVNTPRTSCAPPQGTDCLAGSYWTSTSYPGVPQDTAWFDDISTEGSWQYYADKHLEQGVRCSRALTQ